MNHETKSPKLVFKFEFHGQFYGTVEIFTIQRLSRKKQCPKGLFFLITTSEPYDM